MVGGFEDESHAFREMACPLLVERWHGRRTGLRVWGLWPSGCRLCCSKWRLLYQRHLRACNPQRPNW